MSLLIVFQLRTGDQPQVEVGDASSLSGAASRNGMARTKLPGYLRSAWFQQMLQLSFVGGLTGEYVDFTTAHHAALRMIAARGGRMIGEEEAEEIVGGTRRLPAHPEVAEALRDLREAGFRQVTLTNSPLDVACDQLRFAGLVDLVDDVLSADEVKQLKPGPMPYHLVC